MGYLFKPQYNNEENYNYDTDLIEIVAGKIQLKDIRPSDASFYAKYKTDINATWGDGILTGTPVGGASVLDSKLDLAHNDLRYVEYSAVENADSLQTGCIRFKVIPNFTAGPVTEEKYFSIMQTTDNYTNSIYLRHRTTGDMRLQILDSSGNLIVETISYPNFVSGNTYEVEIDWDIITGATRVFIDGVQFGTTHAGTGIRTVANILRVGTGVYKISNSNFKISDFLIFSTVQHTENYTPDWSNIPETIYSKENPKFTVNEIFRISELLSFMESAVKPGSDEIKYILRKGTKWYYWSGADWLETDNTYLKSSIATDINTNVVTFTSTTENFQLAGFLHSENGDTIPKLDYNEIEVNYQGGQQDDLEKCIVWGYNKTGTGIINRKSIYINLEKDFTRYKNNVILRKEKIKVKPDTDGYWEVELIESLNMSGNGYYIFDFGDGLIMKRKIPDQAEATFKELIR